MNYKIQLLNKIKNKKIKIGIVGLGYVGLPLSISFYKKGFLVYGFDSDKDKIKSLKTGKSYLNTINNKEIIPELFHLFYKYPQDLQIMQPSEMVLYLRKKDLGYIQAQILEY